MRTTHLLAAALTCAIPATCPGAAEAQSQTVPRDTRPAGQQPVPIGTAVISGTVALAGASQPARKVRVNISGQEVRGSRSTTTDDQGRFSFTALPAGRYSLSATKPGYLTVTYGQRRPGTPGTQIQLSDGQKFQAQLQIPRGSVLTGTVLDENGEVTSGTSVRAMRVVMQGGRRTLQSSGSGMTDDRGIYRIFNLQPGEYAVCATPRNSAMSDFDRMQTEAQGLRQALESMANSRAAENEQQAIRARLAAVQSALPQQQDETPTGYAAVCYPGTTTGSEASPIPLGVAEERPGIDFQLQLVPMARVEGTVVNSTGAQIRDIQITLQEASPMSMSLGPNSNARADAEGRFRLMSVAPGSYKVTARGQINPAPPPRVTAPGGSAPPQPVRPEPIVVWASADVVVDGRHVSNVMLNLQNGMSLSGQLVFEGSIPPPTDLTRLRINVSPADPGPMASGGNGRVDASGRFTVPSVAPGRYRMSAGGASGWFVESVNVGGQDAMDFPFEVKPGQNLSGINVTFTDRVSELSGVIVDDKNQPAVDYTMVIFPADQRLWAAGTRRIRTVRPGTDGRYTLGNLPPGDYRIATLIDLEPGAATNPEFLQQIESQTMRITLAAGEKKTQDIRLSR